MQQSMFIGENQKLLKTYVLSLDGLQKVENVQEVLASTVSLDNPIINGQEEEAKDDDYSYN